MDKRADAIRKCGAEIVKLRKYVEVIDEERSRLDSQLKAVYRSAAEAEMVRGRVSSATHTHPIFRKMVVLCDARHIDHGVSTCA